MITTPKSLNVEAWQIVQSSKVTVSGWGFLLLECMSIHFVLDLFTLRPLRGIHLLTEDMALFSLDSIQSTLSADTKNAESINLIQLIQL